MSHNDGPQGPQKDPESNVESSLTSPPPIPLQSNYRQYLIAVCWGLASAICLAITIWLAFATSASVPFTPFKNPSRTVLVINVLSNTSVILLSGFMSELNEKLRWSLASQRSGIDFASFLGLSRATGNMGVVSLVFSSWKIRDKKWCVQRNLNIRVF